jgi:hypothetical protein
MSRTRVSFGIALVVALAACGETGRDPLGPSGGPSLDGGLLVGGNRGQDSTGTNSSTTQPDSSSLENGGLIVGGN